MQHSALRRRTTPAVMRHRVEAAKSSAAPRPPISFNGSDSHRTVRAVFCFSAATGPPLRRFCRRVAAIIVGTTTATAQQAQRSNPFGSSPSRCLRRERPRPKTTPRRPSIAKQTRSAAGKRGHRTKTHPLFRDFPQLFRASPRARPNAPRQRPRSVRPTASLRAKTPSALTFFAFRFASLPIPPYLCAHTCPQNFAPSVVKWPWLGFFSSPCCRNWW